MASSEVTWQTAFLLLPPLAFNTMMQPSGSVCGFDARLRTYLRSSPIVCIGDVICIIVRFTTYIVNPGVSPWRAAKMTKSAREGRRDESLQNTVENGTVDSSTDIQALLDQAVWPRIMLFVFGTLFQIIKLAACSGLGLTQAWGWFYLASFAAVWVMDVFASRETDEVDPPGESWLDVFERIIGHLAVVLQLGFLAWVDLAASPTDQIVIRRWVFRSFRFAAHLVTILVYFAGLSIQATLRRSSFSPGRAALISAILILVLLAGLHEANFRYTLMYVMWSLIISALSWLLYMFTATRKHILLDGSEDGDYRNILAFDFFCRIVCFSLFWYRWYYDPTGTSMPNWINDFGN
jgi:hypothetical protein